MESKDKKDKNQFDKLRDQFTGGNNKDGGNKGKPKFNFYWIYAIIFAVFLGLSFFGGGAATGSKTSFADLKEMLFEMF